MKRGLLHIVIAVFVLMFATTLTGCVKMEAPPDYYHKIENVVRIFMHKTNHYTFLVKTDSPKLRVVEVGADGARDIKILTDVEPGKPSWVQIGGGWFHEKKESYYQINNAKVEIHIRSAKDIEGGGWDHGKHGSGMTQVLQ